jgi:hypothetical protein
MTAVHYLKPSGERVMEVVREVYFRDEYVQWLDQPRGVWVKLPWSRVLLIESNASIASGLVTISTVDEEHHFTAEQMMTIRDDMGGVVTA